MKTKIIYFANAALIAIVISFVTACDGMEDSRTDAGQKMEISLASAVPQSQPVISPAPQHGKVIPPTQPVAPRIALAALSEPEGRDAKTSDTLVLQKKTSFWTCLWGGRPTFSWGHGFKVLPDESFSMSSAHFQGMALALKDYYSTFRSYPSGGNAEIVKALNGDNPDQKVFLNFSSLNDKGEWLDVYDRPYMIEVTPEGRLTVRSSGANGIMNDKDDEYIVRHLLQE